ncbi:hypothetical protein HRS9122_00060 [Pyrenophora teres f. teres]|nr:hypothetical protein HRS9122_00060 [Pyrenophora teres f. teres]
MNVAEAKAFWDKIGATKKEQDVHVIKQIFKDMPAQAKHLLMVEAGLLDPSAAVAKKPTVSAKPGAKTALDVQIQGRRRLLKRPRVDSDASDDDVAGLQNFFKRTKVATDPTPGNLDNPIIVSSASESDPLSSQSSQFAVPELDLSTSSPPSSPQSSSPLPTQGLLRDSKITSFMNKKASPSTAPSSSASTSSCSPQVFIKKEKFSPSGLMKSIYATSSPPAHSFVALSERITGQDTPGHTGDWEDIHGPMKSNKNKIKAGEFMGEDFEETMSHIHQDLPDYKYFMASQELFDRSSPRCDLPVTDALANREVMEPLGDGVCIFPVRKFFFCFGMYKKKNLSEVPRHYIIEEVAYHQRRGTRPWFLKAARIFLANTGVTNRSITTNRPFASSGNNSRASSSRKTIRGYFPKAQTKAQPKPTLADVDATELDNATNLAYFDRLIQQQEEGLEAAEAEQQVAAEMSNAAIEDKGKGETAESGNEETVGKGRDSAGEHYKEAVVSDNFYDTTDTETISEMEIDAVRDEPNSELKL